MRLLREREVDLFLLSDFLVKRAMDRNRLYIEDFSEEHLAGTCYYFRLGRDVERLDGADDDYVNLQRKGFMLLKPGERVNVKSLERFRLSDEIMALLGNVTNNPVQNGILLLHGPSMDPGYGKDSGAGPERRGPVPLDLVILNVSQAEQRLDYGQEIGKAMFFDISDSALEAARLSAAALRRQERMRSAEDDGNPDRAYQTQTRTD